MIRFPRLSVFLMLSASIVLRSYGQDGTIIDQWAAIAAPPVPELKAVRLDPAPSAFLVLDMQKNSCTAQARPRCVASIPKVKAFLETCRARNVFVVHSLTSAAKTEDIVSERAPHAGEPVVRSSVDKFYNTELEKILADRRIKTVVIVGTMAHGAVLHTAAGAAMRGIEVVVPVDGMSSDTAYAEQYTAWHLINSPGTRRSSKLTKFSLIEIP